MTCSTRDRLAKIVRDSLCFHGDALDDDTRLVEDLGADSIDLVEITLEIEDEFHISIPDEAMPGPDATFGSVLQYLEARL